MSNDIEFPEAVCTNSQPHGKHLIAGTWRSECPGVVTEVHSTRTTTKYGTWIQFGDGGLTIEDNVTEALGEFGNDACFDIEAIVTEYRAAINAALPAGWSLDGNDFHGPADRRTVDAQAVIGLALILANGGSNHDGFWNIVAKHEKAVSR